MSEKKLETKTSMRIADELDDIGENGEYLKWEKEGLRLMDIPEQQLTETQK